jgi:lysophospholipase L1-like esterase
MYAAGQYDVALIMEGANDLGNIQAGKTTASAVANGLAQMIDHARAIGMRPFLATIPPENPNPPPPCDPVCRGSEAALVAPYNVQVRAVASSKGVPLVDVEAAFNGNLSLIGPDGLHPNVAGYKVIADAFFAAIEKNLEIGAATTNSATTRLPAAMRIRRR